MSASIESTTCSLCMVNEAAADSSYCPSCAAEIYDLATCSLCGAQHDGESEFFCDDCAAEVE